MIGFEDVLPNAWLSLYILVKIEIFRIKLTHGWYRVTDPKNEHIHILWMAAFNWDYSMPNTNYKR